MIVSSGRLSLEMFLSWAEIALFLGLLESCYVLYHWLEVLGDRSHPYVGPALIVWARLLKLKLVAAATGSWVVGLLLSLSNPGFLSSTLWVLPDSNFVLGRRSTVALMAAGVVARSINRWATGSFVFAWEGGELVVLCLGGVCDTVVLLLAWR